MIDYHRCFDFIRFSLEPEFHTCPNLKKEEWQDVYTFSHEQALVGVLYDGLKYLEEQDVKPPFYLLMEWIASSEQIITQNEIQNKECARLTQLFEANGFNTVILKGQANARLYPTPQSRQPGDIDIWVDGGCEKVMSLLYKLGLIKSINIGEYEGMGEAVKSYHHVHLPPNKLGIDVEVHFRPSSGVWNPFCNKRLQSFLEKEIHQPNEIVEEGFRVPSLRFSLIMQLAHIQKHFFNQGIGLRQLIDYYYLLKSRRNLDEAFISERQLRRYGLLKIARAVMWILNTCFGMDRKYLITSTDSKRGAILLNEIVRGGNFGKYSKERNTDSLGRLFRGRLRKIRLLRFDANEVLWAECKYWKMQVRKTIYRVKK